MRPILKGSTDQSVTIRILDTAGLPVTTVVAATPGLALNYRREGAAVVALTALNDLATLATAHTDGGIKHIAHGYYRVDPQDAAYATGANGVIIEGGATDMVIQGVYIPLVDYNPYDATRMGMTSIPATLVGGRMDSHVGSMADAVMAAAKFASGAFDAVWSVAARLLTAGTNIALAKGTGVTGFNDPTVAAIADAVWDEAMAGHLTGGTTGASLNGAGSAGDPWTTALPGAYGAGTAGALVGAMHTFIDTEVATLLAELAKVPKSDGSVSWNATARAAVGDAVLDEVTEGSTTLREILRGFTAVLLGKANGLEGVTANYRNLADAKNVLTATVDASGNRTALTRDLT